MSEQITLERSVYNRLFQAAEKWHMELTEYVIPYVFEDEYEEKKGEAERLNEALQQASKKAVGVER